MQIATRHCTARDAQAVFDRLHARFSHTVIQGGGSCTGGMTKQGFHAVASGGVLALSDAYSAYGAAAAEIADVARAAARQVTETSSSPWPVTRP